MMDTVSHQKRDKTQKCQRSQEDNNIRQLILMMKQ